jgi:hypothetical protein
LKKKHTHFLSNFHTNKLGNKRNNREIFEH